MTPALEACSVPPTAIAAWQTGLAASDRGDLVTVIAACQEAIVIAPTLGEAYALLAETLASLGRSTAAIAAWRRAIGHHPREIRWYSHLYDLLAPDFALPVVYESEAEIDEWRSRYGAAIDQP